MAIVSGDRRAVLLPPLAILAGRQVPPDLVDPSDARIEAGAITAADLTDGLRAYDPELVVLWTGKLTKLPLALRVVEDRFEPVATFGTVDEGSPRAIYREREPEEE